MANSTLDHEARNLTRRDFLKLCGSSSIAALLAACGAAPTPTPTPTLTHTPFPSHTPNMTPSLTPTPSVTPTAVPYSFKAGDWASNKATGQINLDAVTLYAHNSVNNPKKAMDLTWGPLKVVAIAESNINNLSAENQKVKRDQLVQAYEQDTVLQSQIGKLKAALEKQFSSENLSNFTIAIEKGKNDPNYRVSYLLGQVIDKSQPKDVRFMVMANGELKETTPKVNQRELGERIGLLKGTTFDNVGAERSTWNNPKFQNAVSQHFTIVMPPAAFLPNPPKDANPSENRSRVQKADQYLFIQPGLAPPQDKDILKDKSKDQIIKYEEERIRVFLSFVGKVSEGSKPTYIYLFNEAFWDSNWQSGIGEAGWYTKDIDNPHYKAHGDNLFISLYLMYDKIAKELGLEIGRDFRLLINDYNVNRPKAKVRKMAFEIARTRKEIARLQNKPIDEVYIDAGIQCRFRYQADRSPFHQPPPTEEELREALKILTSAASHVHFTETTIIGDQNQEKITADLRMIDRVAVEEGVKSVTYWLGMLPPGTKDPDVKAWGPSGEPLGLFDSQADPTGENDKVVLNMITTAETCGLI